METGKKTDKNYGKAVVAAVSAVHILIAVIYRLFFYQCGEEYKGWLLVAKQAYPSLLGDRTERIICMLLTFAIGSLLIFVIWHVLCRAWCEKRKAVFIIIGISVIAACILYPYCLFNFENDNALLYYMSSRNVLDYWNSCYMTCIYNACLLVFPSPFILPMLQCSALLGTLYYISLRFRRLFSPKAAWLPWGLLLFPEMQRIAFDPYRNCINTLMCLAFFAVLFCDAVEGKKRTGKELVFLSICAGFLTVFRNEQVLFMFLLLLAIFFVYQCNAKRSFFYMGVMVFSCLAFMLPQKLGEQKYYGKDYSMINNLNALSVILSDERADLSYEGAGEDLAAIDAIVPIAKIKDYGLSGYRGHMFAKNKALNQSFATKENQEAFIRGANSLIFHNPGIYLKARIKMFMVACGREISEDKKEQREIPDEQKAIQEITDMQQAYNEAANFSTLKVGEDTLFIEWLYQADKLQVSEWFVSFFEKETGWLGRNGVILAVRVIVFLIFHVIFIYSNKEGLLDKKRRYFWFGSICLLYVQLLGIFLMSPEGRAVYYYSVFFIMFLGDIVLLCQYMHKKQATVQLKETAAEDSLSA